VRRTLGDFAAALQDADRALELDPSSADLYYFRGHTHFIQQHRAQALADFRRQGEARLYAGEKALLAGDRTAAAGHFRTCLNPASKQAELLIESAAAELRALGEK